MPWTVLIVDDHAGFRHFARELLEDGAASPLSARRSKARTALVAAEAPWPLIVLLDVAAFQSSTGLRSPKRLAGGGQVPPAVVLDIDQRRSTN